MEEIEKLHNVSMEWGCITNLLDKINDFEDKLEGGWPELIDVVVDAVDEESHAVEKDPVTIFFCLYQFLFRLYHRLKMIPEKRAFNIIDKLTVAGKEVYRVTNYDYQMFKWGKKHGFETKITNDYFDVAIDKISDKTRRAFEHRAERG